MKTLFVYNTAQYLYIFRLGLMEALREKGFDVVFCTPRDEYVHRFQERGFRYIPIEMDRKGMNPLSDLRFVYTLFKSYREEKPDLVFHFTPKINIYGAIAARLAGVKCINTVTGLGYAFLEGSFLAKLVKMMYRASFRFPSKIFLQNRDDLRLFLNEKLVDPLKAIIVSGAGIDTEKFYPRASADAVTTRGAGPIFLFIGRILWDKGVGEFVSAARIVKVKHPNARFWLLGPIYAENPSSISRATIMAWESEGVTEYQGVSDDVRPYIAQCDALVLPSYREGMPRAVLEAMAMAKPVITSDAPGCREAVVDGENGFLVPVKDARSLADAMLVFLGLTAEEKTALGENGRRKALSEFDERKVVSLYVEAALDVAGDGTLVKA